MALNRRLQRLELNIKLNSKIPACYVDLFIVIPEEGRHGHFDSNSYRPTDDEIENYLRQIKETGQCHGCVGSCAIDWEPGVFKNHTLQGARSSSSPEPKIFTMFCADAEIPVLTRRIMNGERAE